MRPLPAVARPPLLAVPALLAALLAVGSPHRSPCFAQTPSIRIPSDIGETELARRRQQQLATLDRIEVFAFFSFADKSGESGIDLPPPGRRRRRPRLQDGPLRPRQRPRRRGRRRRRAGPTSTSSLSSAASELCARTWAAAASANITEAGRRRSARPRQVTASFADVDNDGDPDLFVTTVRDGQRPVRERRHGPLHRHHGRPGVDYAGHSSGAVFFDYDRDGLLDLFVTNVGVYTTDRQGPRRVLRRPRRRLRGPPVSRSGPRPSLLYRNLGGGRFVEVVEQAGPGRQRLERRRHLRRPQRGRLARPLRPQHAGRQPLLENERRQALRRRRPPSTSRRRRGARWGSSSSTATTTAGSISTSPTCTRT